MNDPIFFAYATADTPYENEALLLAKSMSTFNLALLLRIIPNFGTWQKNTQYKARLVYDVLSEFPGRTCIYVDVDSLMLKRPELFWHLGATDVAAHMYQERFLASGVVYFQSNPNTLALVQTWIDLCQRYPSKLPDGRDAWDQRVLQMALRAHRNIRFSPLPAAYNFIQDMSGVVYPGVEPVILATRGAKRFHKIIDGKEQGE